MGRFVNLVNCGALITYLKFKGRRENMLLKMLGKIKLLEEEKASWGSTRLFLSLVIYGNE